MTHTMKELLLREFAQGIAAVAKRRNIHIDPTDLQCFLYKNISKCKSYGRSSVKFHIGYDGLILYNCKEIAKTPEEAEKLSNYNILCNIKYRPDKERYKQPTLVVEFQERQPYVYIRAFYGVNKLSNTLCTMYTNLAGTKRSLFNIFIR